jgi:DHA2 family multidrug resistance protein
VVIGPTLEGYIINNASWPYIFYVNLPIGILATILTLTYIKNPNMDTFLLLGRIFLVCVPLVLLIGKGQTQINPADAAH